MSDPNTNPFVLPGMGQDSDLSGNPLLASMEMMRQAWAGLAGPGGLSQALPMTPPLNLEDLERRIAELRTVEGWLRLNLQMLSSTIQGMEVQRATISTLRSFVGSVSSMQTGATPAPGDPSPLEVALGLKPARGQAPQDAPAANAAGEPPEADAAAESAFQQSERVNAAATEASQAWWGLLQQQFNQIAAATAATLPQMMGEAGGMPGFGTPGTPDAGAAAKPPAKEGAAAKPAAKAPAKPRKPAAKKAGTRAAPKAAKPDAKPAARGVAKTSVKPARRSA
ncbi:PhaM family polyhydroxyalkanoate granule multifunctional regulatory protein [Bordetella genomosp. 1]|uniref:Transcriptional regulator n=1 Tax=Bordetella genomosp. 1 TaxID=1395607 RepID=A0ABX4F4C4_9BORD|nr:PhaM family polyhydroxyalkanoate granule multifunctional regulatory protein [Bordetella genomosp. 1]OZI68598.1 transcriptional regulator [Bordetella genomosp. 1]